MKDKLKTLLEDVGMPSNDEVADKIFEFVEILANKKHSETKELIKEEAEKEMRTGMEDLTEQLIKTSDSFCEEVASDYLKEDSEQFTESIKAPLFEKILKNVVNALKEYNIEIPSGESIESKLAEQVETLKKSLNDKVVENLELKEGIERQELLRIFQESVSDLSLLDQDKIRLVMEDMEIGTKEQMLSTVKNLRERVLDLEDDNVMELEEKQGNKRSDNMIVESHDLLPMV